MAFFQEHVNFSPLLSHGLLWFIFVWGFCNHGKTGKLQYLLKIDTDSIFWGDFQHTWALSVVWFSKAISQACWHPTAVWRWECLSIGCWKFSECVEGWVFWCLPNLIFLDNNTVLRAECPVKGFHNVWSRKWTWYFQRGLSLTPAAVACLLIPPKSESVLSHSTFQILSGLFSSKSNYGLKQRAHDVTVLFLAMVLVKKNTSLCLVVVNQSGPCAHTEQSWPFPARLLCSHCSFVRH